MEPLRGVINIVTCGAMWLVLVVITAGIAIVPLALWGWAVFGGAEARGEKAEQRIRDTLMQTEKLTVVAVQLRPFALFRRRQSIGITDSRMIVVSRGLFGGFTMRDIQWKDLEDAEISENVLPGACGSSLSFAFRKHDFGSSRSSQRGNAVASSGLPSLHVAGIPCEEGRSIYSTAQSEEQAWEEKRRVRAIEETRAAAGGVYLNTGGAATTERPRQVVASLVEEITSLKKLLDNGAISDVEFNEMKSKVIARG